MKNYDFVYQQYQGFETFYPTVDSSNGHIIIGAGYDLSTHSKAEIVSDLLNAGFDKKTAQIFSEASFKTDADAKYWVEEHKFLIISDSEHQNLFENVIIPAYEDKLQSQLSTLKDASPDDFGANTENLNDNQKQVLFDFVRKDNLENHPKLTASVVNEDWNGTVNEFEKFEEDSPFRTTIERVFKDLFSNDEEISQQLQPTAQAEEWVLNTSDPIDSTRFSDEGIIDLTVPTTYDFTYNQEIGHQGQSLVPHFPGGKSGVTIGPGYDMGHRTQQEIYDDLTAAGIDPQSVQILMASANKIGSDAQAWVAANHNVHITEEQQRYLFYNVLVPEYELRAQTQIESFLEKHPDVDPELANWDNLSDKQKQMLFDFAYNPGLDRFPTVTNAILHEDWETVYHSFERFSAGQPLAFRNEQFYNEFLNEDLHYDYHKVIEENATDDNPYDDYFS